MTETQKTLNKAYGSTLMHKDNPNNPDFKESTATLVLTEREQATVMSALNEYYQKIADEMTKNQAYPQSKLDILDDCTSINGRLNEQHKG